MNAADRMTVLKLLQEIQKLDCLFLRVDRQENLEQKEAAWEDAFDYYKLVRKHFLDFADTADR